MNAHHVLLKFALASALGLLSIPTATAALITNGSFEDPFLSSPSRVNISSLNNWTASGGFMLLERGVNSTSNLAAHDGEQFVSFGHNGNFNDQLSQVFNTQPGEDYLVQLYLTSIQGNANQTMRTSVFDAIDNLINFTDSTVSLSNTWVPGISLAFTATSLTTRLEFQHTVGSNSANIALDDVRVTRVSAPLPSALPLTAMGLLLLTGIRQNKRL